MGQQQKTIFFTGGGSGGHAVPAHLVLRSVLAKRNDLEFHYLGRRRGIERDLLEGEEGVRYTTILAGKLHRRFTLRQVKEGLLFAMGFLQSVAFFARQRKIGQRQLVFATGGYVSLPVVLAARCLGYKIWLHEQTSRAGLANRIASQCCQKVFISFEASRRGFPAKKVFFSGYPLRRDFESLGPPKSLVFMGRNLARLKRPVILFCGGGNGSKLINDLVEQYFFLLVSRFVVLHQCGRGWVGSRPEQSPHYLPFGFTSQMPDLMKASTLVVSRSGAGMVSECMALKKPSMFIPLAHARGNEQLFNAREALRRLPGKILLQSELKSIHLVREIEGLLKNLPKQPKLSPRQQRNESKHSALNLITQQIEAFYSH